MKEKEKKEVYQEEENYNNYYECYLGCGKYNNEKQYVQHFAKQHPDDYPFYCYDCRRGFYASTSIDEHLKNSRKHKKK